MSRSLCLLLTLCVCAAIAEARQLGLAGTVVDPSGAVVPGAQVAVTRENSADEDRRTTTTDELGRFTVGGLAAGTYRVEVVAPGFSLTVRTGIEVSSSASASLRVELQRRSGQRARPPAASRPGAGREAPAAEAPPPPPPPPKPAALPGPVAATPSGLAVVPVFYATDRARAPTPTLDYASARNPAANLVMGRYDVSIPRDHQMGSVERPSIWTLYREDPESHLVITSRRQLSYGDFYDDIRTVVGRSTRKDAFVFVHGFNVAFEDAVFRTAQMAYDLGFDGAPILYSWPSDTGETPIGYTAAQNNNDWTVAHLDYFLRDVATKTGATRIHLIAHSMGNRALVNALNRMPLAATKRFNQIVLTAPDMDAQTFVELSDAITRNGELTTLYVSASDKALAVSKRLNAYPRAGDTGAGVVIVPGIDTVDVTAVDSNFVGHFYYAENRSVISDIRQLLTEGLAASRRTLRSEGVAPRLFWRFVP